MYFLKNKIYLLLNYTDIMDYIALIMIVYLIFVFRLMFMYAA